MKTKSMNVLTVGALCCMLLCACNHNTGNGGAGSEGNVETADKTDSVQKTVKYNVNLSKDVYDFFDVELVYTDANGENVVRKVTDNIQLTVQPEAGVDSTVMKITTRPKKDMPVIDDTKVYKYNVNYSMTVDEGKNKGKNHGSNKSMSMKGDKWRNFVTEEQAVMSEVAKL